MKSIEDIPQVPQEPGDVVTLKIKMCRNHDGKLLLKILEMQEGYPYATALSYLVATKAQEQAIESLLRTEGQVWSFPRVEVD